MSIENANVTASETTVSNPTTEAPAAKVYTSELLVKLEGEKVELFKKWKASETEDEADKINLERLTNKKAIAAEIQRLKDEEKAAEVEALKAVQVAFVTTFEAAVIKANAKGATVEDKDALNAARVALIDQVLTTVKKAPQASGTASNGAAVPAKGSKSAEILSLYQGYRAEGKSNGEAVKAIVLAGYNDGTVNAVSKAERIRTGEWINK